IENLLAFLLWLVSTPLFLNSWLKHLLHWYLNIYIVTNKRIINITRSGIFRRQMTETSFHKVQDVTVKTLGLVSMLLDYGDVVVQTAGHATYIHLYAVPKPREIHKKIVNTLAKYHFHPQSEKPGQPSFMAAKTHEP